MVAVDSPSAGLESIGRNHPDIDMVAFVGDIRANTLN
jgi:hypothetical protein